MRTARIFKLDEGAPHTKRFVCGLDGLSLSDGTVRRTVTITRTGTFTDRRYGKFDITRDMLLSMVRNFDANTYGQDIFLDVNHEPGKGAAAKVIKLSVDGNRLRAEVEFTPYGVDAVKQRGFRYLSAEFSDDYVDNERGQSHGPTLLGAALTTRPVIKRLDPVELAESQSDIPVFLHPELVRSLSQSLEQFTMNWLEKLRASLKQGGYSDRIITAITGAYTTASKNLGEDQTAHQQLHDQLLGMAKTLSEEHQKAPEAPIVITLAAPAAAAAKLLTEDDVRKMLADDRKKNEDDAKKLGETKAARVKVFTDLVDAATGLSDGTKAEVKKASELITADMSDDQCKRLAEMQISMGNMAESAKKLSAIGFHRTGTAHITMEEGNAIKSLSESIRKGLAQTGEAASGRLRIVEPDKQSPFVKKLLAEFDSINAQRLHEEAKQLSAGGVTGVADVSVPASFTREVILQTYQDFLIMQLINANVDPTQSATHLIPYEVRNTGGVTNAGRTFEGQPIQSAGVTQLNDNAYIFARKLALELSNEVIWFTRQNQNINYDAWARNIASNALLMRELVATDIANRMQRDADAYGCVDIANEASTASTVAAHAYKTANFPVVRPVQEYDLVGNTIGAAQQPITVKDGATVLLQYDGTGTQVAGKYWRILSYNLGIIQLVDQTGAPVAPAGAVTYSYSYATNVYAVDTDIAAGSTYRQQMNQIIQGVGNRNAALAASPRFVKADFLLQSVVLNNLASDAEVFSANFQRADSSINSAGDLQPIKNIPAFSTNAPGIDLGDERTLIGQRGNFWYTVAKPYAVGEPVERIDNNGKFLGKKHAYGEEYASMKIPVPLRSRYTSLLAYSHLNARG